MRWVVLAIVVSITVYTYLTLHYRKTAPAYRPYEDMKNRMNTRRLIDAGFQRIPLGTGRPADLALTRNTALPAPGGLPAALGSTLISTPRLPADILDVQAPSVGQSREAYHIICRCRVADDRHQLGSAELYVKSDEVIITPDFEQLASGLETRSRDSVVTFTIPAGALKPGNYRVTLVGEHSSRAWSVELR
jgi:hypothetical protein